MRRCDIGPGRPRIGSFLQCCIVIVHRAEGDVGDGTTVAGTIGCYRFSASAPLSIKYTFRQQRLTITEKKSWALANVVLLSFFPFPLDAEGEDGGGGLRRMKRRPGGTGRNEGEKSNSQNMRHRRPYLDFLPPVPSPSTKHNFSLQWGVFEMS